MWTDQRLFQSRYTVSLANSESSFPETVTKLQAKHNLVMTGLLPTCHII